MLNLDPAELRERIAELDRQLAALVVLLRAARARRQGQQPSTAILPAGVVPGHDAAGPTVAPMTASVKGATAEAIHDLAQAVRESKREQ
jgi:hypothetical protein